MSDARKSNIGLVALIVALVAVLGLGRAAYSLLSSPSDAAQVATSATAAAAGPESSVLLASFALTDAGGNRVDSLDLLDGKPLIINFWATWCPYCIDEMDDYQRLFDEYGADVNFVMIDAADGVDETVEKAAAYVDEHDYTFPVYYDTTGAAVSAFSVRAFPTTVLVDSDGTIRVISPGRISYEAVAQQLYLLA